MGNEVMNYNSAYAAAAEEYASGEQLTGGTFLSTRGGIMKFGEEEMPGNQVCVVILDSVFENTFYEDDYDPDAPVSPKCFAFARGSEKSEMAPDPELMPDDYFVIQSAAEDGGCGACEWNKFGTADKGRGKACQNRRRLAIIPAGFYEKKRGSRDFDLTLIEDVEHYRKEEIAFLKLSVTSTKEYAKYVAGLSAKHQRPPFGVVTRIYLEPDPKSQYKTHFELLELLPEELAPIVFERNEEAKKTIITPYAPPQEETPASRGADRSQRQARR